MTKVFFNASAILAGLHSSSGGSAKLLDWVKKNKIKGIISEVIFDEAVRRADKINLSKTEMRKKISAISFSILPAPKKETVESYYPLVIDLGDAHVLASTDEVRANYLVTLDKKHLILLKKKIRKFSIVTPKELIESLRE